MTDHEHRQQPLLVIPPCGPHDCIQVVVSPGMRQHINDLLATRGWSLFPIPCEEGHEQDDLPTFGIQQRIDT